MERAYWPQLDIPFKDLLGKLPRDAEERGGPVEYGVTELPRWAETLRRAANTAFAAPTEGLDSSARSLKAVARAQRRLKWEVAKALADTQPDASRKKEGAA
jgi:hypothetical protein